jgi:uncharacterized cupin superfamily protein
MAVNRLNGIVWGNVDEAEFVQAPSYGENYQARVWEVDRSADGRRSIALFEQHGSTDFEYSCDEVVIVRRGTLRCTFDDGQFVELRRGDIAFFPKGTKGHFDVSEDFSDIAVFLSDDAPVDII